jgi:hypothetical protein
VWSGDSSSAAALFRGSGKGVVAVLLGLAGTPPGQAQEAPPAGEQIAPWREVWAGADVGSHVWLLYTGTTLSPFAGIHDEGLKLRVLSGYGGYSYEGLRRGPGNVPELHKFSAESAFTDLLAGYLFRFGPLTAKAFAGVSAINHGIRPFDPENEVQGLDWGAKGVVELWLDVHPDWWVSLDTSFTTAHETFASRLRAAYRLQPELSLGLEAGFDANALDQGARAGLFLRYEWDGGEISASAGITSGDVGGLAGGSMPDDFSPYATVNVLFQF